MNERQERLKNIRKKKFIPMISEFDVGFTN